MTNTKVISKLITVFAIGLFSSLLISCSENKPNKVSDRKEQKPAAQKYDGVTIEVDISNKNLLAILLAADGTINRKGTAAFDPNDKDFFMGLADNKAFDSLMNEIPDELFAYCNVKVPECDTLKQTCAAKIAFANDVSVCEIQYCVNGTMNNLPKPIRDFITRSIEVTDPWYTARRKSIKGK